MKTKRQPKLENCVSNLNLFLEWREDIENIKSKELKQLIERQLFLFYTEHKDGMCSQCELNFLKMVKDCLSEVMGKESLASLTQAISDVANVIKTN